jgi:hypothetical protein
VRVWLMFLFVLCLVSEKMEEENQIGKFVFSFSLEKGIFNSVFIFIFLEISYVSLSGSF